MRLPGIWSRARSLVSRGAATYVDTFRNATPNARRYLAAVVLQNAGIGLIGVVFAIYVKTAGFSVTVVGDVEGALSLAAGVVCVLVPPLVVVVGYRALFVVAALAYGLARIGQVAGIGPAGIVGLGLLYGLGDGIIRSVGLAFLSESANERGRTYLFTIDFVLRIAASVVGALVGGLMPTVLGSVMTDVSALRWTIVLGGVLFIASAIPALGMRRAVAVGSGAGAHGGGGRAMTWPWATYAHAIREFRSWDRLVRLSVPQALTSFGAGLVMPFVPLFLKSHFGASVAHIGVISGVSSVLMVAATLFTPFLTRRIGLVATIVVTMSASLPLLLVIPLAPSLVVVAFVMWFRTALMNMSWPAYNQLTVDGVVSRDKPLVAGWTNVAWSLAWFAGSVLGGRLNEWSYTRPYFITTAIYALATLANWLLLRKIEVGRTEGTSMTEEARDVSGQELRA